jgi:hypothetical protein
MLRFIAAVITGYLIFAMSAALLFQFAGQDPHAAPSLAFAVCSVVWGMLFAALGGYTAAVTAQQQSLVAGIVVGCLIATGAITSLIMEKQQGSIWSQLSALLLMAPAACSGGFIFERLQKAKRRTDKG